MCGVCGGASRKIDKRLEARARRFGRAGLSKIDKNGKTLQQTHVRRLGGGAGLKSIKTGQPIGEPASGVRGAVFEKSFSEGEGGDGLSDKKRKTH